MSIIELLLFPIFRNNVADAIVSEMGIFANDTTFYSQHMSKINVHIYNVMAEYKKYKTNFQSVVEWGHKWIVTFNTTEIKLLSFNNYK